MYFIWKCLYFTNIIEVLPGIVETLRKISPVNVNMDKLEIQGEKVWTN
jgi:hypothetical protein